MPMATSTFLPKNMSQPENPSLNPNSSTYMSNNINYDNNFLPDIDLLEYLAFINQSEEDSSSTIFTPSLSQSPPPISSQEMTTSYTDQSSLNFIPVDGLKKDKMDARLRIAFRMKTELEIVDDGYKWRKYGKKMVKNSPNPRNYYKCSRGGCSVKKRVERDGENSSYVITTYEGVHNHTN